MSIQFTDREPVPRTPKRSPHDIALVLNDLKENAGKWAIYSTHTTRGGANSRMFKARNSKSYRDYPLEWRTMVDEPGVPDSKSHVMVRWLA